MGGGGDACGIDSRHTPCKFLLYAKRLLAVIGMLILGICAGWSSEMSVVLIVVHIALLVYAFACRRDMSLPTWYYAGIIGLCIGWLIVYNSPGSAKRTALFIENGWFLTLGDIWAMSLQEKWQLLNSKFGRAESRFASAFVVIMCILYAFVYAKYLKASKLSESGGRLESKNALDSASNSSAKHIALQILLPLSIVAIVVLANVARLGFVAMACCIIATLALGFVLKRLDSSDSVLIATKNALFIQAALLVIYALYIGTTLQVHIPPRARLQYQILQIMLSVSFFVIVAQWWRGFAKSFAVIMLACCVAYGSFVVAESMHMRYKWEQMLGIIEAHKKLGALDVEISKDTFISRYKNYTDWGNPDKNADEWPNNVYAHYFGIKSLVAKDAEDMDSK